MPEKDPRGLLPLTPAVLQILLSLADEERHGYGIMREVEDRTGGGVRMGPGTLYGSIKRMLVDGLIEESDERPDPELDDSRRHYYRITDFGRSEEHTSELQSRQYLVCRLLLEKKKKNI